MTLQRAVIVGASHAGAQLAAGLRQEGWTGEIVLIGEESALPYQRPPLSKAYLAGKSTLGELAIRSAEFYSKQGIQLLEATVEAIDRSAGHLSLSTGDALPYDKLALCTGARPRRLPTPGADLAGVYYLRTAADVEKIREATSPGRRAVIVGGGYIGLETAASLRALGLEVTVLEATGRVLERVTAPEVSAFFDRIHREEGVNIRTGARVEALSGDGRVREVILASGESIPADLVIVGIGVEPNTELAAAAGLVVDNGVVIDDQTRTSDPDIVAAGDCASHDMARYGRRIRLESVPSAGEQAKVAAATVCGKSKKIAALPWFWSDQYDLKLQIAGLNTGYDEVVLRGDPTRDRDFTCFYLRAGELIAADCIKRPRDFMFSKRVITQQLPIDRAELVLAGSA
ncbi:MULTISPECIES: NAD(P)/FAD-dependent oxidoreductase [unclassified Rhodococcus (in: high G+C Gram-positive bacteria)]|uniref:NAD(P)/FAD-dependent oxidoreductase n=1 Tax=unclassified Rhodococcus (in: high G+C Gram-positive bacteria) TaxID=192944 RepID=UPI0002A2A82E|nr:MULTISPECIES: FAD-dependent oxidoreductase [unclassified Rhodococcus (in: high G+C Gram-positive bacteria)]ELB94754.1 FAD-dependent pyridine nucleotide-disulfide oxidoreductase [Rhodococcus wratislaviensis IFP 2016]MBC2637554.1 FAD-dependent oxidoreductase [Rhodococcus sp. 3A]MBC2898122.1 FAD-dependent oxidoreductase [Rhodococcus sp. 4CII]